MKHLAIASAALTMVASLLAAGAQHTTEPIRLREHPAAVHPKPFKDRLSPRVRRRLAQVRAATSKYHDPEKARADGYVPFFPCEEIPGVGSMGERWINFGLLDDVVDELRPELLHYLPASSGPTLMAVEYTLPLLINGAPWFGEQAPPVLPPAPRLFFGEIEMLGPFFEDPSAPWHYNLFAWIWRRNPSGVFEPLNPKVRCP